MQTRDHIHCSLGLAAIYYSAVGLEKMLQKENRQRMENREQTEKGEQGTDRETNYRGHSNPD